MTESPPLSAQKPRFEVLDLIRGIAALLVCVCHFRHALPESIRALAKHGELGVYAFFVISGFIIPFSMARGNYQLQHLAAFWRKRLLRLQPTYLVAVLVTFILSYGSAQLRGESSGFSAAEMFWSTIYLHIPSENPVIWTLIVELKYYVLISCLFPALFSSDARWRIATFLGLALLSALPIAREETKFLPYFLLGFAGCYFALNLCARREFVALALTALAAAWIHATLLPLCVAAVTLLVIHLNPRADFKVAAFLGTISYSLYLLHFPLGVKFINALSPRVAESYHVLLFLLAIAVSIFTAWVVYFFVEKPSSEASQRVKFRPAPLPLRS